MKRNPGTWPRLELHQNVDVAVESGVLTQDRAEKGQLTDVMAPAKLGNILFGYGGLHRTQNLKSASKAERASPGEGLSLSLANS